MIDKLLTEHHLDFLSLKGGCRGSPESTLVKMPHCWKSHGAAHFVCFSASIRRTSMRGEKRPLFKKEAQEEALHFGVISRDDDDDEFPSIVSVWNALGVCSPFNNISG